MDSEPAPRRSTRAHQPSAKAAAASASSSLPPAPSTSSRRPQRRRVTLSASPASTPASTRNSSPMGGPASSPASSDIVSGVVDAIGPNGQRRRLRAAAHTGSTSSVTQGLHFTDSRVHNDDKVLGRYSSHDCALLCEVIMSQLKKQTMAPTVLDEAKSPAFIRWEPVAKKMETTHKLRIAPRECQILWKFLAYGEIPVVEDDELLPDSDEEDFHKTPKEINAQVAARRAKVAEVKPEDAAAEEEAVKVQDQVATDQETPKSSEEVEKNKTGADQEETHGDDTLDAQGSESSVRLYPTYTLPTGAPDAWYRPFGPKDALPLTFVASRFLRRKANPSIQVLTGTSTATLSSSAAGTASTTDLKRKQAVPMIPAKKPKLATPSVLTPPRMFTTSSTPPPAAKRAKTELEFFELRLRDEHAKKTPGAKFDLSAADIQRRFGEASAEVRRQCQVLAAHDVERFNREVVRVRIWQKAMGAGSIQPKPTQTLAAKSTISPSQATASTISAASTTPSSAQIPATTQRPGPTAALLAHTAAVTATAARVQSTAMTSATTSAPHTDQKNGGIASANSDAT